MFIYAGIRLCPYPCYMQAPAIIMNTEHPDAMTAEPVVEATKEPLKRTASLKKVTQKLAKALSLNGIKSRLR